MKKSQKEHEAYIRYLDENFDEEEYIIVPETIWGEIAYIYFILKDMLLTRKDIKNKYRLLKQQLQFFKRWQCLKYNIKVKDFRPKIKLGEEE